MYSIACPSWLLTSSSSFCFDFISTPTILNVKKASWRIEIEGRVDASLPSLSLSLPLCNRKSCQPTHILAFLTNRTTTDPKHRSDYDGNERKKKKEKEKLIRLIFRWKNDQWHHMVWRGDMLTGDLTNVDSMLTYLPESWRKERRKTNGGITRRCVMIGANGSSRLFVCSCFGARRWKRKRENNN